jgi:hypothetical protein
MESLIPPKEESLPALSSRGNPRVVNFNEEEEATCIVTLNCLTESYFKCYFLLPLCSLLTIFYLPVKLYWSVPARVAWMYSPVPSLVEASHMFVRGKDGNNQIVKLQNLTEKVRNINQG